MLTVVTARPSRRGVLALSALAAVLALVTMALVSLTVEAQSAETVVISQTLEPAQLEIEVGATVVWRNQDGERHRIRSEDGPEEFDSGNLETGETFSHTFAIEGSYPYYDHRDRDDTAYFGMVVVGGSATAIDGPLPGTGSVSIIDRAFRPPSFTIATGGTVEWSNDDGEAHTVTSTDAAFDSGILDGGSTFSQGFAEPGTYPYFCLIHQEMRGTITVSDPVDDPGLGEPVVDEPSLAASGDPVVGSPVASGDPVLGSPLASADPVSGSPVASASAIAEPGASVSVIDRSFQPGQVDIQVGETVRWANDDSEGHTVTALDGTFNSGVLTVGDEFSTEFDTAGSYDYFCAIHPDMTGTVTVTEPGG